MSGFAVGMVLLPLLAATLIGPYGWRGGVLVLGAIMGNILPNTCAYVMSPRIDPSRTCTSKQEVGTNDGNVPDENKMEPNVSSNLTNELDNKVDKNELHEEACWRKEKRVSTSQEESVSLRSVDEGDDPSDFRPLSHDKDSILPNGNVSKTGKKRNDVYKDSFFILVTIASFVHAMTYAGWHAFLIPHALQRGISLRHTVVITLCASVGNLIGRFLGGSLTHRLVKPIDVYLVLTFANVGFLLCYVFVRKFSAMLFLSLLSACSILGRAIMPTLVLRERSPEDFQFAFASLDVSEGLGSLIGGYLSGRSSQHALIIACMYIRYSRTKWNLEEVHDSYYFQIIFWSYFLLFTIWTIFYSVSFRLLSAPVFFGLALAWCGVGTRQSSGTILSNSSTTRSPITS